MIQRISFKEPSCFELSLPEGVPPFPLICLTPILGRFLFLDDLFWERRLACFFASQGFAAALIDRPIFEFEPTEGLEQIQKYLEASISRSQRVLDLLLTRDEIQPKKIGSFGASFGAVINSLWAASDSRLKAHVFALAGGNLPEILVSSRDPLMRSYLKAIKALLTPAFSPQREENLKSILKKSISIDPLTLAPSLPRENIFMVLARFDRVIRFRYGLALWQALGKPETLLLPLGHYTSLLALPWLKWKVIEFFKKKLLGENHS